MSQRPPPPPFVLPCCAPSIFGKAPLSEIESRVAEFLYKHCDTPNIELEAKLGRLISRSTNERFGKSQPRIDSETVLFSDPKSHHPYMFLAAVPADIFERINMELNKRWTISRDNRQYKGGSIHCLSYVERDWIFGRGYDKIRATVDEHGTILRCIRKSTLEHLNIMCKSCGLDWRVSASTEEDCAPPPLDTIEQERVKHRCSYSFEFWQFDLTRVEVFKDKRKIETVYQVEIEIKDLRTFIKRKQEIMTANPEATTELAPPYDVSFSSFPVGNRIADLAKAFVNNVRMCVIKGGVSEEVDDFED
ncbi:hypothetical protein RCL1_001085 [Eukaryota sp. TZLM3-RCL]